MLIPLKKILDIILDQEMSEEGKHKTFLMRMIEAVSITAISTLVVIVIYTVWETSQSNTTKLSETVSKVSNMEKLLAEELSYKRGELNTLKTNQVQILSTLAVLEHQMEEFEEEGPPAPAPVPLAYNAPDEDWEAVDFESLKNDVINLDRVQQQAVQAQQAQAEYIEKIEKIKK